MFGAAKNADSATNNSPGPFGKYYLQELVSSGGMADIWLATDSQGKAYALRRLHERLRFNLVRASQVRPGRGDPFSIHNHSCVIGYVEHGKIEGQLYLLMEYVEGDNLKDLYAQA